MNFSIEYEQEEDGRWLAEVVGLPGVLAYGETPQGRHGEGRIARAAGSG